MEEGDSALAGDSEEEGLERDEPQTALVNRFERRDWFLKAELM